MIFDCCDDMQERLIELEKDRLEQARLLGISGSKELKLLSDLSTMKEKLDFVKSSLVTVLSEVDDTGTGGYVEDVINEILEKLK